jgi:hypothetical protein
MANFWMYGFWFMYFLFIITVYKAYLSKLVNILRYRNRFLHYHIIDTGEYGEKVFKDGENKIDGVSRIYSKDHVTNGTLFYEKDNAEPLKVKRALDLYKYYCDTKNYDTVARNDILPTLLILNAKNLIIALIVIGIFMSVASIVASWIFTNSIQNSLNSQFGAVAEQITHLAKVGG